jgi:hypothetical protein
MICVAATSFSREGNLPLSRKGVLIDRCGRWSIATVTTLDPMLATKADYLPTNISTCLPSKAHRGPGMAALCRFVSDINIEHIFGAAHDGDGHAAARYPVSAHNGG